MTETHETTEHHPFTECRATAHLFGGFEEVHCEVCHRPETDPVHDVGESASLGLGFAVALLCILFAWAAQSQPTTHGKVIDVGSVSTVMLAIRLPYVPETPAAIDYVQDSVGRTVWTSGSEWVLLPLASTCVNGTRNPIGLVTVCPPRPEGGHMDACMVPSMGVPPIYRDSPVTTECVSRRRVVRR